MIDSNFDNQSSGRRFCVNEEIAGPSVRVVGGDNLNHGVFTVAEAIRMARGLGLDLVEIAPNARPPGPSVASQMWSATSGVASTWWPDSHLQVGHWFMLERLRTGATVAHMRPNQITAHNAGIAPQLAIGHHRPGVCEFFRSAF